jgi:hypothetical protein
MVFLIHSVSSKNISLKPRKELKVCAQVMSTYLTLCCGSAYFIRLPKFRWFVQRNQIDTFFSTQTYK